MLGGMDRFLMERSQHMLGYLGLSALAHAVSQGIGEMSRPWWQGLPQPTTKAPVMVRRRVSKKVSRRVPRSSLAVPVAAAVMADEAAKSFGEGSAAGQQSFEQAEALSYESAPEVLPVSMEQQSFDAVSVQQQMQQLAAQQAAQQALQEESEEAPRRRRAPQGRRQSSL